jgi:Ni,Fe-hydrogenase III large subunit
MNQTAKKTLRVECNDRDFPVIVIDGSDNERRVELPKLDEIFDSYALIDYLKANYPDYECKEIRWKNVKKGEKHERN